MMTYNRLGDDDFASVPPGAILEEVIGQSKLLFDGSPNALDGDVGARLMGRNDYLAQRADNGRL